MSKAGMNWLLTVAVVAAAGAIGAGAYYMSQSDGSVDISVKNAAENLKAATSSQPTAGESGSSTTQPSKAEASKAPQQAAVSSEAANAESAGIPSFDVMRVEPSGDAVVAGRAEAGSIVALVSNGDVVGRGIANERGEFAIVLEKPLKPGDHDVSLQAQNKDTQETVESEQHIAVSVPETDEGEVLVVLNSPDQPSKILQLPEEPVQAEPVEVVTAETSAPIAPAQTEQAEQTAQAKQSEPAATAEQTLPQSTAVVSAEGQPEAASPQVAQAETEAAPTASAANTPAGDVSVKAVETENGKVFVAGQSEPGSDVRVYVGEELVGQAKTDEKGHWQVESSQDVAEGTVEVRADKLADDQGNVAARAQVVFTKTRDDVVLVPVRLVAEGSGSRGGAAVAGVGDLPNVIIRRGDNLWTISRRLYGKGTRYTTIYQANSSQIRNPDLIYPGQVFLLPVSDLNWKNIQN